MIDIIGNSKDFNEQRWDFICQYLSKNKDRLFDSECVDAFLKAFSKESFQDLRDDSFESELWKIIPREKQDLDWETCKNVADFFAKIVDYKSGVKDIDFSRLYDGLQVQLVLYMDAMEESLK